MRASKGAEHQSSEIRSRSFDSVFTFGGSPPEKVGHGKSNDHRKSIEKTQVPPTPSSSTALASSPAAVPCTVRGGRQHWQLSTPSTTHVPEHQEGGGLRASTVVAVLVRASPSTQVPSVACNAGERGTADAEAGSSGGTTTEPKLNASRKGRLVGEPVCGSSGGEVPSGTGQVDQMSPGGASGRLVIEDG